MTRHHTWDWKVVDDTKSNTHVGGTDATREVFGANVCPVDTLNP